jgi:hypothetical protein
LDHLQTEKGKRDMEVSAELRKPAMQEWVTAIEVTNLLLGGVTAVIHPTTYTTGVNCVKAIERSSSIVKTENLGDLLKVWTTPFVAASVISNRDTPLHRDNGATYGSMDVLASVGPFEHAKFMVPSLGYELLFSSGTVIGLLGRVVPHGAQASGERMCFAQYLRENILSTLRVDGPEWVNIVDI